MRSSETSAFGGWHAEQLPQLCDGPLAKILEAQECFVGRLACLADCLIPSAVSTFQDPGGRFTLPIGVSPGSAGVAANSAEAASRFRNMRLRILIASADRFSFADITAGDALLAINSRSRSSSSVVHSLRWPFRIKPCPWPIARCARHMFGACGRAFSCRRTGLRRSQLRTCGAYAPTRSPPSTICGNSALAEPGELNTIARSEFGHGASQRSVVFVKSCLTIGSDLCRSRLREGTYRGFLTATCHRIEQ